MPIEAIDNAARIDGGLMFDRLMMNDAARLGH